MDIEISGNLAYRHSSLSDQLHSIKLKLTSKMTIPFSHIHASLPIIQTLRRVHQFGGRSDRNLYKRILVISKGKNPRLWEKLIKFRSKFGWDMIVHLQQEIQRRVVDLIRNIDDSKRTTSILEPTATERVITLSEKGTILILVDIPKSRPGSAIPLEYLPEADRREMLEEWKEPSTLEDSVIWTQLHDHFLESVGKIRVFCHPDVLDILKVAIMKTELEDIIEASIRYLEKEK